MNSKLPFITILFAAGQLLAVDSIRFTESLTDRLVTYTDPDLGSYSEVATSVAVTFNATVRVPGLDAAPFSDDAEVELSLGGLLFGDYLGNADSGGPNSATFFLYVDDVDGNGDPIERRVGQITFSRSGNGADLLTITASYTVPFGPTVAAEDLVLAGEVGPVRGQVEMRASAGGLEYVNDLVFYSGNVSATHRTVGSGDFAEEFDLYSVSLTGANDATKPTVAITLPKVGQLLSNAVITATGTAKDNVGVESVLYQINGGDWLEAEGTTNWQAGAELRPGPNTLRAFALDATGNRSATNTVSFTYVVMTPLEVQITGKGTVNPNYNAKLLQIGKAYTMSAVPGVGFVLTNWTGSITTNKALLSFIMQSNLTFTANFVDVQKPVVTITAPTISQRWSNAVFTVRGKATDNGSVAEVWYQLNGNPWALATGTTNWESGVELVPGPNSLRAFALDASGNRSVTNTVNFTYVLSAPLEVQIAGKGTVNPNYNGKLLEIGKVHTMTAMPGLGFVFTNWTGSVTSNKALLSFVMQSNLTFTANFVDVQKPVVTITAPTGGMRATNLLFTARGTATDNSQVAQVFWRLNGGDWQVADGTTAWTADLDLFLGGHSLSVYAVDETGNRSATNTVNFSVPSYQGIYTGKFAGQSDSGGFAVLIYSNQTGVVVGWNTPQDEGVSAGGFAVPLNGRFSLVTDQAGSAGGTFTATGVSGTFTNSMGQRGNFSGTRRPDTGIQRTNAGLYDGTYSGYYNGNAHAILAADGTLFFYTWEEGGTDGEGGGFGTVNAQNTLSGTVAPDGITIVGALDPIAQTISGSYKSGATTLGTFSLTRITDVLTPGGAAMPMGSMTSVSGEAALAETPLLEAEQATTNPEAGSPGTEPGLLVSVPPGQIVNRITAAQRLVGGQFQLVFIGLPDQSCVIECSTDMLTWQPVATNAVNRDGLLEFTDSTAPNRAHSFYRVRMAP